MQHYAGPVGYDGEGFLEKNRDTLNFDLIELLQKSTSGFINTLYAPRKRAVIYFGWVFFFDFVRRSGTTRAEGPHVGPQHVRGAKRYRINRRSLVALPLILKVPARHDAVDDGAQGQPRQAVHGPAGAAHAAAVPHRAALHPVHQTQREQAAVRTPALLPCYLASSRTYSLLLDTALQGSFRPGIYMCRTICCWFWVSSRTHSLLLGTALHGTCSKVASGLGFV